MTKKQFIIGVLVVLLIVVATVLFKSGEKSNYNANTSTAIQKEKEFFNKINIK